MNEEMKTTETSRTPANRIFMLESTGGSQMNSFIIQTASGALIVIDGGYDCDASNLINRLQQISGLDIPKVDAWFLSHCHQDHINAFLKIMRNQKDALEVKQIFCNFPSLQFVERNENWEAHTLAEFYRLLPVFADRIVIVSAGDRYEIGGAVFDILYSPDPAFTHNAVNNSSIIMRMTLGEKTTLFTGDAGVEAGQKLLAQMGDALKSDICQMAHHGQNGVERDFYAVVSPKACLWCTPKWLWENDNGKGYNTHEWKTIEVQGWMEELGVKEHYIMKDGEQEILL